MELVFDFHRGYTPEVFLNNIELKLTAPLERLCERYPQSPTIAEIKELLANFGKVKSHNSNPSTFDLFL